MVGQWKPLVTTEEFEQGLAILTSRQKHRARGGLKHKYFLRGLVYVALDNGKIVRLMCSTPNASRPSGGTSYYCIASSNINIMCHIVDDQIQAEIMKIQVDPNMIPIIRQSYTDEVSETLGRMRPSQRADLERKLKEVNDEEERALRLYAVGKLSDRVWDNLWQEWQDRRQTLRQALESVQMQNETHIQNLDDALTIIAKVGILYSRLERASQRKLLREMVAKVIVCPKGTILRMELLPPFAYLKDVITRVRQSSEDTGRKTKTSTVAGQRARYVSSDTPTGSRTRAQGLGNLCSIL